MLRSWAKEELSQDGPKKEMLDVATKVPILTWSPTTRRAKRRRKARGSLWNARY